MAQRTVRYLELQILADTRGLNGPLTAGGARVRQFATEADRAGGRVGALGLRTRGFASDARAMGTGVRGLSGSIGELAVRVAEANSSFSDFSRGGAGVVATAASIGAAFGALAGVKFDATMEQLRIGFEDLLGSGKAADDMLRRLYKLAADTPFEFQDVTKAERKLVGLGVSAEKAYKWLSIIGDATAGVGGGADELERIVRAVSQIQAKGKLSMEELNQIGETGLPGQEMIRKELRLTKAEFTKTFTAGNALPADRALDALMSAMDKRYRGMAERQSRTFNGQLDKLKDQSRQAAGAAMEPLFDALKNVLPVLSDEVTSAAPVIARALSSITGEFKEMTEDGSLQNGIQDLGTAIKTVAVPIGAVAKLALGAVHAFEGLPDPIRSSAITFGVLWLASNKLASSLGLVGVKAAQANSEVAALQAAASRSDGAVVRPSSPYPAASGAQVSTPYRGASRQLRRLDVNAERTGRERVEALRAWAGASRTAEAADSAHTAAVARQAAAEDAATRATERRRLAVQDLARAQRTADGLSTSAGLGFASQGRRELAQNELERRASALRVATAEQQAAEASRRATAAVVARTASEREVAAANLTEARAAKRAATDTASAAAQRLASARADAALDGLDNSNPVGLNSRQIRQAQLRQNGSSRMGAWLRSFALGGMDPDDPDAPKRSRVKGIAKGAGGAGLAGALGVAMSGGSTAEAALAAGSVGMVGGPLVALGAAGAAAFGSELKHWIDDHGEEEGKRLGEAMGPGFDKGFKEQFGKTLQGLGDLKRDAKVAEAGGNPDDNFIDGALRALGLEGPSKAKPGQAEQLARQLREKQAAAGRRLAGEVAKNAGADGGRGMSYESIRRDTKRLLEVGDKDLGSEGKAQGARAVVQWAQGMESKGQLVKGTARKLAKAITYEFTYLDGQLTGEAASAVVGLAAGLKNPAAVDAARDLVRKLQESYRDLPHTARLTASNVGDALEGILHTLKSRLPGLTGAAKKAAESDIAALKEQIRSLKSTAAADLENLGKSLAKAFDGSASGVRNASKAIGQYVDAAKAAAGDGFLDKILATASALADVTDAANGAIDTAKPKKKRVGGWNRYNGGGSIPTLMSGGERVLEPADVAAWESSFPGALSWVEQNQAPHFAKGGPVGRYNLGGWTVPGPSDRDGTFVPATPGSFVLTGDGQRMLSDLAGFRKGGPLSITKVAGLAKNEWSRGQDAATATAVAGAESSFDPNARNGHYRGLMQVGDASIHPRFAKRNLFDPAQNMKSAHDLWLDGGWKPWEAYTNGAYKKFLAKAQRAVGVSDTVGSSSKSDEGSTESSHLEEKTVKSRRSATVGYTVYNDPPPGAFGPLDNGYAELGTARRTDGKATGVGWIARALGLKGELPAHTPLSVTINGKTKTLTKEDRGYGQGGDGKTSDRSYAIDIWKDSWKAFGLNANSKGRATVALGSGSKLGAGHEGATIRTPLVLGKSKTRTGLLDDPFDTGYQAGLSGYSRTNWATRGLGAKNPVRSAVRSALDAQANAYTKDVNKDSRTTKTRVWDSDSGSDNGTLTGSGNSVIARARSIGKQDIQGAHAGMQAYARMGKVFGLGVSSGKRAAGQRTASGGVSQHGSGDAVDIAGGPKNMLRFAKWLGSSGVAAKADQVIHTPLGYGWSGGKRVPLSFFGAAVNKGHYDHVHIGDSTPPKLRRGGTIRRFGGGGSIPGATRFNPTLTPAAPAATKALAAGLAAVKKGATDAALGKLDRALGDASTVRIETFARDLLKQIRKGGDKKAVARLQAAYDQAVGEIGQRVGERVKAATDAIAKYDRQSNTREARFALGFGVKAGSSAAIAGGIAEDQAALARGGAFDVAQGKLDKALRIAERNKRPEEAQAIRDQMADLNDRKLATSYAIQQAQQELPRQQVTEALAGNDLRMALAGLTESLDDDRKVTEDRTGVVEQALAAAQARGDQDSITQLASELGQLRQTLKDTQFAEPRRQVAEVLKDYDYRDALASLTDDGADDAAARADRERFLAVELDKAQARDDRDAVVDLASALKSLRDTITDERDRQQALTDALKTVADNQSRLLNLTTAEQAALTAGFAALVNGSIGGLAAQGLATSFVPGQKARY